MDTSWERAIAKVRGERAGTGVVVDRNERLLLTCAHVVGGRAQVQVCFPGHDAVLTAEAVENWAPALDAALLQMKEPLPEEVAEAPLGLEVVSGHRFRSRGYHYVGEGAPLPIEGEIRGLGELGGQLAIILSSVEVAEGMSGAPLVDVASGLVVGLIRRYHEQERWLACGVSLSAVADRWPRLRELTVEARYRDLLRAAYGFWERRFTPLEMTAQKRERLSEARRGWIPPCFSALEEEVSEEGDEEPPVFRRVPLPGGLPQALDRYGAVVLLGVPGAGKTTALAHLAGQLAADSARLPILVSLRRYEQGEEPLAFLRRTWALALQDDLVGAIRAGETEAVPIHQVEEAVAPMATLLEHLLERGRLVLLLDGLNEMPGLASDDPRLSWLAAFVERAQARGNRVVVACRMLDYAPLRRLLDRPLQQVTLEPLDDGRIRVFLCGYLGDEERKELARWLEQRERQAVRELCRVPFFLRLVAYLYEREKEPPARRVDLLDRYVHVAMKREQERLRQDWPSALLVEPLSDLALKMQGREALEIWESEARQHLAAFPEGEAGAALRVAEGAGLLRATLTTDPRGARLRFVHQLWQQDLAARALVRRISEDSIALLEGLWPRLVEGRWTEVLTLAAARLKNATPMVERLLEVNARDEGWRRPLFLAAAVLFEGAVVAEAQRRHVLDELERLARMPGWEGESALSALGLLAEVTPYAAHRLLDMARDAAVDARGRVKAARILGQLGRGDDAAPILLALTRDPSMNAQVRVEAARVLGQLGRIDDAVPILLTLARDPAVNARVRVEAAKALGELDRASDAVSILLTLARDKEKHIYVWASEKAVWALGQLGRVDELLDLARDGVVQAQVRVTAARMLISLERIDDAALILLALASDSAIDTRGCLEAARALGELGRADDAATILLALARDNAVDMWVRVKAAEAVGELGRTDDLLALARDSALDKWIRGGAAKTLAELGRADGLLTLARDNTVDKWTRIQAAKSLGELGWADDAAVILLTLAHDGEVHWLLRVEAAKALRELGRADEAAQAWLALARDSEVLESYMRVQAVEVLGKMGRANDLLALARNNVVEPRIRVKAAKVLGELGPVDDAAPILLALAGDDTVDTLVRIEAAKALGQPGHADDATHILLTLARDSALKTGWRIEAAKAVGELGMGDDAAPILLALARDGAMDTWVRVKAAQALGELGQVEYAVPILLALACDNAVGARVRAEAAKTLGELSWADEAAQAWLALARDSAVEPWRRVQAAKALSELGQADSAVSILSALGRDDTVAARVRLETADALSNLGHSNEAATVYAIIGDDESLEISTRSQALGAAAWHCAQQSHYMEALVLYRKRIALNPEDSKAWEDVGNTLVQIGELEEALVAYQKAIELAPRRASAHYGLGSVFLAKRQLTQARREFETAFRIDSSTEHRFQHNLALLSLQQGNHRAAVEQFEKAVELDPTCISAVGGLALTYQLTGQPDEAIRVLGNAVRRHPHNSELHWQLGELYLQANRQDDARNEFYQALDLDPHFIDRMVARFRSQGARLVDILNKQLTGVKIQSGADAAGFVALQAAGILIWLDRVSDAIPVMLPVATEPEAGAEMRMLAAEMLGRLGSTAATPEVLAELLKVADDGIAPKEVRQAARQALQQLESQQE